jgi:hypothetical protein
MASLVAAMSRASTSGVRRAKAFLEPSGLEIHVSLRLRVSSLPQRSLPDEGVELDGLDIVKSLESGLDLPLVGLDVDNEDKGVVLLDHLHGALSVERVDDDLGGIEARLTRDAPAGVGRGARKLEGLREVEGGAGADLADLVRVDLLGNRPSE